MATGVTFDGVDPAARPPAADRPVTGAASGDYRDELTTAEDPTLASTHLGHSDAVQAVVAHWSSDGEIDLITEYDPEHRSRFTAAVAPIIEFHGSIDTTIPIAHALRVQREYANLSRPYELHVLEGCGHGAWCYDGHGNCSCSDGVAGYNPTMDAIALPFVAKQLDLELGM